MFNRFLLNYYNKVQAKVERLAELTQEWERFISYDSYLTWRWKHYFIASIETYKTNWILDFIFSLLFNSERRKVFSISKQIRNDLLNKLDAYNEEFIQRRLFQHKSLFDGQDDNTGIPLDVDQRRAVVVDDQHNLVVAGAGSGKTSVLTMRIAYLLRRADSIAASRILALAFNRPAAEGVNERLKKQFGVDVTVKTFHSFGLSILRENKVHYDDVKQDTTEDVGKVFDTLVSTKHPFQQLFIRYLSNHLQVEKKETDFKTKEEYYKYMNNQRYLTLSGIQVKSLAEREIANFLYRNNIQFEYEKLVDWIPKQAYKRYHPDFYLLKYDTYIEHWGVDREMRTAPWMDNDKYLADQAWKQKQFKLRNKKLIESWGYEYQEGTLIDNLKMSLQTVLPHIRFDEMTHEELVNKVYKPKDDKAREIKKLIGTVISQAKSNFLGPDDLEKKLNEGTFNPKTRLFGEMALMVYQQYESHLEESNCIDFNDMINKAVRLIRSNPEAYANRYDHILIDEFQDMSYQRLELVRCFVNDDTNTKLFGVGDDWQSINKFAGAEVEYFVNFDKYFSMPAISYIQTNYRSIKSIVDISKKLISNNKNQIHKNVVASDGSTEKINLYRLKESTDCFNKAQAMHVTQSVEELLSQGVKPTDILVISRFKKPLFEVENLIKQSQIPEINKVRVQTIHKSKGTQAMHVFILGMTSGVLGFPSDIVDDSVLEIIKPLVSNTDANEEERRLFYVALTRSKRYLYLYTQDGAESIFLNEIKEAIETN